MMSLFVFADRKELCTVFSFSRNLAPFHYKLPAIGHKNSQGDPQLFGSPPTQQPFMSNNKAKRTSDDAAVVLMMISK